MARLRELQLADIDNMYLWMSNSEVMQSLILGRSLISKEEIAVFIRNSWIDKKNIHFAIVTDDNDYVGTVSLKNINYIDRNAEYAIAIRREFWGKGFSNYATNEIIKFGFNRLNLHKIYLNVMTENIRANNFYLKYGFELEGILKEHIYIDGKYADLKLYCLIRNHYQQKGEKR